MMYDLFADFYLKSSDSHPKFTVQIGSYFPKTIGEMEDLGFIEDANSDPGYLDYFMEADEDVLEHFTQAGYECEILDIIFSGFDWERIQIRALEVEVIDDEGHHPPKGIMIGDTFVTFEKPCSNQSVIFAKGNPFDENMSDNIVGFSIPMWRVKRRLGVKTLTEAKEKMQEMVSEKGWTYNEFYKFFRYGNSNKILLDEIIPAFGMGNYIAFTLKDKFEKRAEIKDYDPVVMFIKRTGCVPEYWFDRAHVAETLAPMSLWEIKDDEREKWTHWLSRNFKCSQLENLLTEYADAIAIIENSETTTT